MGNIGSTLAAEHAKMNRRLQFAGAVVANLGELPQEIVDAYLLQMDQIPGALRRGFAMRSGLPDSENEKKSTSIKAETALLEIVGSIYVPATTSKFVAKEKFVLDTGPESKVKIRFLGDNFKVWFLLGDGKIEDPICEQTLCYAKLRKASEDGTIIEKLGGEEEAETTLSEVFYLIEKQKKGESGVLLNNGCANIFYIKDQDGVLRKFDISWGHCGWDICACSVDGPDGWGGSHRVFCRSSSLEPSKNLIPAKEPFYATKHP